MDALFERILKIAHGYSTLYPAPYIIDQMIAGLQARDSGQLSDMAAEFYCAVPPKKKRKVLALIVSA